jgi:hypothetical protein
MGEMYCWIMRVLGLRHQHTWNLTVPSGATPTPEMIAQNDHRTSDVKVILGQQREPFEEASSSGVVTCIL